EEIGCPAFALEDVDLGEVERNLELRQSEPDLVAITGAPHRIERKPPDPSVIFYASTVLPAAFTCKAWPLRGALRGWRKRVKTDRRSLLDRNNCCVAERR